MMIQQTHTETAQLLLRITVVMFVFIVVIALMIWRLFTAPTIRSSTDR